MPGYIVLPVLSQLLCEAGACTESDGSSHETLAWGWVKANQQANRSANDAADGSDEF